MLRRSCSMLVVFVGLFLTSHARAGDKPQVIFNRLCAQCHGNDGGGMQSIAAPAIAGMASWYVERQLHNFKTGVRGTHPGDIAGTRMAPMARFLRSDEELTLVAKYVAEMPPVKQPRTITGSIVKGEARFQICAACHGAAGEGNQVTNGPRLAGASDWYLLTQLKNFKHGVRAGDPTRDPIGAGMAANAAALDDQAMLDLVSYINTLSGN